MKVVIAGISVPARRVEETFNDLTVTIAGEGYSGLRPSSRPVKVTLEFDGQKRSWNARCVHRNHVWEKVINWAADSHIRYEASTVLVFMHGGSDMTE